MERKITCPEGQKECKRFAQGWFCPFASIEDLEDREDHLDCPDSPEYIWMFFKTWSERYELRK